MDRNRTGWQRGWVRALTSLLTLAVMAMIFAFSTEDAEHSDETSGKVTKVILSVVCPGFEEMSAEEQRGTYDAVQYAVRKTAHYSEYLLLGFCLRLCLESWFGHLRKKRFVYGGASWAAGTLYAVTDELHQKLIDGRSGQLLDVGIDSAGVLTGVLLASLLVWLGLKRLRAGG